LIKTVTSTFTIDRKFDYSTVRAMVIQSLEKIVREELNRHIGSINLHKIDIQGDEDEDDDDGDIVIAIDSTGMKVTNRGQWLREK
jgi:hypothetical protein